MDDLSSSMMNGADPKAENGQGGGMDIGDLLGALGGAALDSGSGQSVGMDMGALVGLLGGGSQGAGAGAAGGLLEGLLGGGGAGQGSGLIVSLLGAVLGGGGGTGLDSFLAPIATSLAEKLGLPPEIAQAVVAFALDKLLSGKLGGTGAGGRSQETEEVDKLLAQMSRGQSVEPGILESSGMTEELMEKTGLDRAMAERSLQEAFDLLGEGMTSGSAPPQPRDGPELDQFSTGGLGALRDGWE